jgi:hypothetical protein
LLAASGVEFLYLAPGSTASLSTGSVDAASRGGWQMLWPNAGAACTVE